eukprot:gene15915-7249_t
MLAAGTLNQRIFNGWSDGSRRSPLERNLPRSVSIHSPGGVINCSSLLDRLNCQGLEPKQLRLLPNNAAAITFATIKDREKFYRLPFVSRPAAWSWEPRMRNPPPIWVRIRNKPEELLFDCSASWVSEPSEESDSDTEGSQVEEDAHPLDDNRPPPPSYKIRALETTDEMSVDVEGQPECTSPNTPETTEATNEDEPVSTAKELIQTGSWGDQTEDYKISSKAFALRLQQVLPFVLNKDQTCSVPGRSIFENSMLVRDSIDYCNEKFLPLALVKIDQEKPFDRVNWSFLEKVL